MFIEWLMRSACLSEHQLYHLRQTNLWSEFVPCSPALVIRAADSSEIASTCNLSLKLSMPGGVNFPGLSKDDFPCVAWKGLETLIEVTVFVMWVVKGVDTMTVFSTLR